MELKYCPQCGIELLVKKENGCKRMFCPKCKEFIYENPVPVVAGVILDKKKRILLIKRGIEPCKGSWSLPTGFMEMDENPEESVIREIKEETNLDCEVTQLLGIYKQKGWRYRSVIVFAYLVNVVRGESKPSDDAVDLKYFEYQDLPQIPFKSHKDIIRDIFFEKDNPEK